TQHCRHYGLREASGSPTCPSPAEPWVGTGRADWSTWLRASSSGPASLLGYFENDLPPYMSRGQALMRLGRLGQRKDGGDRNLHPHGLGGAPKPPAPPVAGDGVMGDDLDPLALSWRRLDAMGIGEAAAGPQSLKAPGERVAARQPQDRVDALRCECPGLCP